MASYATDRARDRIAELAGRGYDLVTFWQEATEVVARAVPHYWTPCWYTLDPASLLVTSHFHEGLDELPPEWLATSTTRTTSISWPRWRGRSAASRRRTTRADGRGVGCARPVS